MTTWSVVEEDSGKKRRQHSPFRYFPGVLPRFALLACLALVMVSLGVALAPVRPQEPVEPPFSERARSAALVAALRLKTAGEQLGRPAPDAGAGTAIPALAPTVTLLTTQARALLAPHDFPRDGSDPAPPASPPGSSPAPLPASVPALAAGLAESGSQRLADAALADGGMARLLAAAGTAQLLQASALAAGAGAAGPGEAPAQAGGNPAADAPPSAACPSPDGTVPSPPPEQDASAAGGALDGDALEGEALAATARAEAEAVYRYQVALTRLDGAAAQTAAGQLARHEAALDSAETLARKNCLPVPPREAGYALEQSFLAAPGAGLAALETSTLAVYGDLVALSDGEIRRWGIAGLLEASRSAVLWGADPGPLPGLAAEPAALPPLPAGTPAASPAVTPAASPAASPAGR